MLAPAPFLGDWSSLIDNGTLSFDYRLLAVPASGNPLPYEVGVSGPGGTLVWTSPNPGVTTDWVHYSIDIAEPSWSVTSGTFQGALENVTQMRIRVRVFDNTEPGIRMGLDNIVLAPVPEPASLAVLASGALALLRRRRRA